MDPNTGRLLAELPGSQGADASQGSRGRGRADEGVGGEEEEEEEELRPASPKYDEPYLVTLNFYGLEGGAARGSQRSRASSLERHSLGSDHGDQVLRPDPVLPLAASCEVGTMDSKADSAHPLAASCNVVTTDSKDEVHPIAASCKVVTTDSKPDPGHPLAASCEVTTDGTADPAHLLAASCEVTTDSKADATHPLAASCELRTTDSKADTHPLAASCEVVTTDSTAEAHPLAASCEAVTTDSKADSTHPLAAICEVTTDSKDEAHPLAASCEVTMMERQTGEASGSGERVAEKEGYGSGCGGCVKEPDGRSTLEPASSADGSAPERGVKRGSGAIAASTAECEASGVSGGGDLGEAGAPPAATCTAGGARVPESQTGTVAAEVGFGPVEMGEGATASAAGVVAAEVGSVAAGAGASSGAVPRVERAEGLSKRMSTAIGGGKRKTSAGGVPGGVSQITPPTPTQTWGQAGLATQTGFALSGGKQAQQVTVVSLEVQAACRGEMRPDPAVDPVQFIVLAVHDDATDPAGVAGTTLVLIHDSSVTTPAAQGSSAGSPQAHPSPPRGSDTHVGEAPQGGEGGHEGGDAVGRRTAAGRRPRRSTAAEGQAGCEVLLYPTEEALLRGFLQIVQAAPARQLGRVSTADTDDTQRWPSPHTRSPGVAATRGGGGGSAGLGAGSAKEARQKGPQGYSHIVCAEERRRKRRRQRPQQRSVPEVDDEEEGGSGAAGRRRRAASGFPTAAVAKDSSDSGGNPGIPMQQGGALPEAKRHRPAEPGEISDGGDAATKLPRTSHIDEAEEDDVLASMEALQVAMEEQASPESLDDSPEAGMRDLAMPPPPASPPAPPVIALRLRAHGAPSLRDGPPQQPGHAAIRLDGLVQHEEQGGAAVQMDSPGALLTEAMGAAEADIVPAGLATKVVIGRASTATEADIASRVPELPSRRERADEYGESHASGIHLAGRVVLNLWRLLRSEVKLGIYTFENCVAAVLRHRVPHVPAHRLARWFTGAAGSGGRARCVEYLTRRAQINLQLVDHLDLLNRTAELARLFGIEFYSVLSRGSQYRVESMLLRLAHTQNFLMLSPSKAQVNDQPAMECLPLVMEPQSRLYTDPMVVLDFQSLYPSQMIAYNLCYSTCLGRVPPAGASPAAARTLGAAKLSLPPGTLAKLAGGLTITPNGVLFAPPEVRRGVLPRLLNEILNTRIMVKAAMKRAGQGSAARVLQRVLNSRQFGLKLIANVTYGYTAAGFSGRMPCAELADSIVQSGRATLERAIEMIESNQRWGGRVVYGDTDSLFVHLPGRTRQEAFQLGAEMAAAVTAANPAPVCLKLEKVYQPCVLVTKKRYVGMKYEGPKQTVGSFEAKGIETVRRDTCPVVAKVMEKSLRLLFQPPHDLSRVKAYLQRQWGKTFSGRVSAEDFVFAKEVRLGTYSDRYGLVPPAAIVAGRAMAKDPRAAPQYGERVPYVVVCGEPGARLVDLVVDPHALLDNPGTMQLHAVYYITKHVVPSLQRILGLAGANVLAWYTEMPRTYRARSTKRPPGGGASALGMAAAAGPQTIDLFYLSQHCAVCDALTTAAQAVCPA
eukprot:gene6039-7257_t